MLSKTRCLWTVGTMRGSCYILVISLWVSGFRDNTHAQAADGLRNQTVNRFISVVIFM